MVIVWVSLGYGYNHGSGRVINNETDIKAHCMLSNSIRKLGAELVNGPDAHKKLCVCVCAASLLIFSLAFLRPLFPYTFISTSSPGHS